MAEPFKAGRLPRTSPWKSCTVAAMAAGGMTHCPTTAQSSRCSHHGLTHRQRTANIFAITCIKTAAVFVVIAVYYLTGIV